MYVKPLFLITMTSCAGRSGVEGTTGWWNENPATRDPIANVPVPVGDPSLPVAKREPRRPHSTSRPDIANGGTGLPASVDIRAYKTAARAQSTAARRKLLRILTPRCRSAKK